MLRVALVVAGLLPAGCSAGARAVTSLYGEVHVHQYPEGAHPAALFLGQPIAAANARGDSVLPTVPSPSRVEGSCALTSPTACAPPCGQIPALVDGGAVHVRGGLATGAVDLVFDAQSGSYDAEPPLARGRSIFFGGELLSIDGDGAQAPAFHGQLRAPAPLVLVAPQAPIAVANGLTVSWTPGTATRVAISLVVSTPDGRVAILQCEAPDAAGTFSLPLSLLALLPATPRDLQLEVSRDQLARVPSMAAGEGVLLHAGFAITLDGHEP